MAFKHLVLAASLVLSGTSDAQSAMDAGAAILSERASTHAKRGRLRSAERDLNIALDARPREKRYYKQRGAVRFCRHNYAGATQDLDVYISAVPQDRPAVLLRALAERSLTSENIPNSCAELLPVREALPHMGLEMYCATQPGW